jgi:hypothetical protein
VRSYASIEATAEAVTLRLVSLAALGAPVVPPVGRRATTFPGAPAAGELSRQPKSGLKVSSPKATRPSSGIGITRLSVGTTPTRPSTFSNNPPGAPGGGANRIFARAAFSCETMASRLKRRLSGWTVAKHIAAQ